MLQSLLLVLCGCFAFHVQKKELKFIFIIEVVLLLERVFFSDVFVVVVVGLNMGVLCWCVFFVLGLCYWLWCILGNSVCFVILCLKIRQCPNIDLLI